MGSSGLLGDFGSVKEIGETMKTQLDNDVQKILHQSAKDVEDLLIKNRALLDAFAAELLAKEELDYDQMEQIFKSFGKVRGGGNE
jgi:ATP-dependent Zn protease